LLRVPDSTYRLQLHRDFAFSRARSLVSYLKSLGISDMYSSPVLKARPGSVHCYDVVDYSVVNPELGGEAGLDELARALSDSGMGLLLDIVPNHMSASTENPYWMDVLEYGRRSPHGFLFDIDWEPPAPAPKNKVLLPILDLPLGEAVVKGEVRLAIGSGDRPFVVRAEGLELPVSQASYPALASRLESAARNDAEKRLAAGLWGAARTSRSGFERMKAALNGALKRDGRLKGFASRAVHGDGGLLSGVVGLQHYLLAPWEDSNTKLNYRRFLSVNELVALRVEDPRVFAATHRVVLGLLRARKATGLRVDHADGLRDPALYFRRLKSNYGREGGPGEVYVLAEKVLQAGKKLPPEWEVSGTTGYGFMNELNGLFVKTENAERFDRIYRRFSGETASFSESVREGRLLAVQNMRSELRRLAVLLSKASPTGGTVRDLGVAIKEVAASFDGYRTYISPRSRAVRGNWRGRIVRAVAESRRRDVEKAALQAVEDALLLKHRKAMAGPERSSSLEFVLRFQQFTAAVAVKGEEDTALYRYNRLVSLNEVGGDPEEFGLPVPEFHRRCRERLRVKPYSMVATSTHDTKRSEDVRARIDVLSEMPDSWEDAIWRWRRLTTGAKGPGASRRAPTQNDEYLFYQTLLGAWPHPGTGDHAEFVERMVAYMRKASKEERRETSWMEPSQTYDRGLELFVRRTLRRATGKAFLNDLAGFRRAIDWYGMLNSLSQTLVKLTAPGVPDTYQGNEVWDYSLVDPDNRRGVDFSIREAMLARLDGTLAKEGALAAAKGALRAMGTGLSKLYLTASVLRFRAANGALFREGGYTPVWGAGPGRDNLCSFARDGPAGSCLVCAPRFFSELCEEGEFPLGRATWGGTRLSLPPNHPESYVNVLTGEWVGVQGPKNRASIVAAEVFSSFPVALLRGA
jgi:(1->4)-alpha-D-glucan 1-alpha-D-glucosylmutase